MWKDTIKQIQNNGSKIVFQLVHGGGHCTESLSHHQPITPSGITKGTRAIKESEIDEVIESFIRSAKNFQQVGADGIQIHCAHGTLLSDFISPILNQRTDKYGGSVRNRARIIHEIIAGIREVTNDSFIVGIKIMGEEFVKGGMNPKLCVETVKELPKLDFIEASCTDPRYVSRSIYNEDLIRRNSKIAEQIIPIAKKMTEGIPFIEGYNLPQAILLKKAFPSTVVACVGGWKHADKMEEAVKSGEIDMISLSRPFFKDPYLVKHLKEGAKEVQCEFCSLCALSPDGPIRCRNWI